MTRDGLKFEIASPCPAKWEQMAGDARVRFCNACTRSVYDFSSMTRAEIDALIASSDGRVCARLYLRADGTVLTADCPVGLRERAARAARTTWLRVVALAGAAAALLGFATLQDDEVALPPPPQAVARLPEIQRGPPPAPHVDPGTMTRTADTRFASWFRPQSGPRVIGMLIMRRPSGTSP